MASEAERAIMARLEAVELFMNSNRLADPRPGMGDRNIARTLMGMETHVNALIINPHMHVNAIVEKKMKDEFYEIFDSKLETAIQFTRASKRED